MKIVVVGGTGRIGSKLVRRLKEHGHEAVPASPSTGVDTLSKEGLADVLVNAAVVIDASNSRNFDEKTAMDFFTKSTSNLLSFEEAAGVTHHVAISVVGTDRPSEVGYFHAKAAQEKLIKDSSMPHSIVHATQFFEFVRTIADSPIQDDTIHLPPVLIQPVAADDVASVVAGVAVGMPLKSFVEMAGPETFRLDELAGLALSARGDLRAVIADPKEPYFGGLLSERTLLPGGHAQLGEVRFEDWLYERATGTAAAGAGA